jgi:beta-lactamase class A
MLCRSLVLSLAFFFSVVPPATGQSLDSLRNKLAIVASQLNAEIGVCMLNLGNDDTLSIRGTQHFPMQSVFKLHLAVAVLNSVDRSQLSMDQKVHVGPEDIFSTWSPLATKYPHGDVDLTVKELLTYMVGHSDNVACDVLFKLEGGPASVQKFMQTLGVKDVSIAANEGTMHGDWGIQFSNWTTPDASTNLLSRFFKGEFLSTSSHSFLWDAMVNCSTGPRRIKGLLPSEVIVAHRTGTGGPNEEGILGAVNDIGIFKALNGDHIVLSVYISKVADEQVKAEKTIATISRLIYDHYSR